MGAAVEMRVCVHGVAPVGSDDVEGFEVGLDEEGGSGGWNAGVVD